jgi:hypothetical protein
MKSGRSAELKVSFADAILEARKTHTRRTMEAIITIKPSLRAPRSAGVFVNEKP